MPTISVLLPVFNSAPYVASAVQSILNQTFSDFEFIIIDDGSTDNSLELLKTFEDSRIRLVSRPNKGIAETRNELIGMASGKYLACMDNDDISHPTRFADQVDFLEAHPEVSVVGAKGVFIDSDGDELSEFLDLFTHQEITEALLKTQLGIIHPVAMIRRNAMLEVNGYRDEFRYAEDLDLLLRLGEKGQLRNIDKVLISYRVHSSNASQSFGDAQSRSAWRAAGEALTRQGISRDNIEVREYVHETPLQQQRKWAWLAHGDGNLRTALKHATRLVRQESREIQNWHLFGVIIRDIVFGRRALHNNSMHSGRERQFIRLS